MNELSWLIYAADVAGSMNVWFLVIGILSVIVCVVAILWPVMLDPEMASWLHREKEYKRWPSITTPPGDKPEPKPIMGRRPLIKSCLVVFLASISLGIFTPSSGTLYAIAASEMGERVIQSETGGKAVDALNAWLDRQIDAPAQEPAQ